MIFRPTIYHRAVIDSDTLCFTKLIIKDTEKINKIIDFCKEIGLDCRTIEDTKDPITRIVITIPYKEVLNNETRRKN